MRAFTTLVLDSPQLLQASTPALSGGTFQASGFSGIANDGRKSPSTADAITTATRSGLEPPKPTRWRREDFVWGFRSYRQNDLEASHLVPLRHHETLESALVMQWPIEIWI